MNSINTVTSSSTASSACLPSADAPLLPSGGHVIIAGFGLPGRSIAEKLRAIGTPYVVIETNPDTVTRCRLAHHQMILGDARLEETLRAAAIESAVWLAVMIPVDDVVLAVVRTARRLNPNLKILARTAFTSIGMEAIRLGASDIIVAEQAVANEAVKVIARTLLKESAKPHTVEPPPTL